MRIDATEPVLVNCCILQNQKTFGNPTQLKIQKIESMKNWQLKYLGEQLLKLQTQKYQIALTGLFLYDDDLKAYQPTIEYPIAGKRIDLYYESCKLAIEIDEPFHILNLEDDKKREQEISKEIPGIQFFRIDISKGSWLEKYLEIKNKILENKILPWLESDVVSEFKKLNEIKTKEIGAQINSISKYLFGNKAIATSPEKYSGVYINEGKNVSGNYYIAVVNYNQDLGEDNSKISFVVFDKKIISEHSTSLINKGWTKDEKSLECILKQFDINQDYIIKSKEEQFQLLKEFIQDHFKDIHPLNKKLKEEDLESFLLL